MTNRTFRCSTCGRVHDDPTNAINCHVKKELKLNLLPGDIVRVPSIQFREIDGDEKWVYKTRPNETVDVFFVVSLITPAYGDYTYARYHLSTNAFSGDKILKTGYLDENQKHLITKVFNPPDEIKQEGANLVGRRGSFRIDI